VQDAILADARRSPVANVIDFRYWWTTDKGTYAPKGGQNLAPRQFERQWKGGRPADKNLARMAADYRRRAPDKAIICDFPQGAWEFVCAGGSMPNLPRSTDPQLLAAIPRMQPWPEACADRRWVLREPGRQYLVYLASGASTELDLSQETASFSVRSVSLETGAVTDLPQRLAPGKAMLPKPATSAVLWLTREP
jgi:hypothetical protein